MLKQCSLCGYTYVEGNLDTEIAHDERHNKFAQSIAPAPCLMLEPYLEQYPEGAWIDRRGPSWLREEIYWRAKLFQREFGYDTPQWEIDGRSDPSAIGFAFYDSDYRIIGASCFRPDHTSDERMRLDWVWLCPSARRQGVLMSHWIKFRDRFGIFLIEGPVSTAMLKFLQRHFPDHRVSKPYISYPRRPMERFSDIKQ